MADTNTDAAKESVKPDTNNAQAKEVYTKAGVLFEQNKFEEAIALYTEAITIDPTYASAYFNRALSYAILNKYTEAMADAQKVLSLEPESFDAPYVMGIIYEYQHDYETAASWYEKALARNPGYEQARARLEQIKSKISPTSVPPQESAGAIPKQSEDTLVQEGQLKKVGSIVIASVYSAIASSNLFCSKSTPALV